MVQGQQVGCSLLKGGVPSNGGFSLLSSIPSSSFFQRRSCCLALTSLIIAFDRVVALVSSQAGFLHVLYKLKDGDAVNSSGVSVSQEGRLEAEPSQSLIFLLAVLWRGCRKVWEEQKSKQVSGLEVRLKGAGRFTAAVGGHNPLL